MNILIINGPNLNLLGKREKSIYGEKNFDDFLADLQQRYVSHQITYFQSNIEGEIIDKIQEAGFSCDGIILNPGAYTHTSIAILDALKAVALPAVEVHISDPSQREPFRQTSYAGMACIRTFAGLGLEGYRQAILYLKQYLLDHPGHSGR